MKTGLITGAASGLGWELAKACHARGDALLLTDIDAAGLAARVAELGTQRVFGIAGDITDTQLHHRLLDACRGRFGRLDALDARRERLFPDRGSWLASLLWRLTPGLYCRQMSRRFAAEMA